MICRHSLSLITFFTLLGLYEHFNCSVRSSVVLTTCLCDRKIIFSLSLFGCDAFHLAELKSNSVRWL